MEMAATLGAAIWGTNPGGTGTAIDGIDLAVDATLPYAGLDPATETWWKSSETATTEDISLNSLNRLFSNASKGGRHPSIIISQQNAYNEYWRLGVNTQQIWQGPQAYDEQLYAGGFTNLLFNGVPWVTDPNVPNGANDISSVYMLNEDYIYWCVSPRGDMVITDFQEGITQDAMVAKMLFAGNLVVTNRARHAKHTGFQSA
jgi:hypothetical protein